MAHGDETLSTPINRLDAAVPREGARVRLETGAVPDESRIVANEAGCLRFGIELPRAGLEPAVSP